MKLKTKFDIVKSCLRYKFFGIRVPIFVSLGVTGRCNLSCPYCYARSDERKKEDVPTETLMRWIDEFYAQGTRIFILHGGEPLLHPDIVTVANHAKRKGCYVAVSTNGTVHGPLSQLKGIVDYIQFCVDGPIEINDKTRGPGTFSKTVEAAMMCQQLKISFHLHSVLGATNKDEKNVRYVARLATDLGTTLNVCFAVNSEFNQPNAAAWQVSDNEVHAGYEMILRLKREGLPISNSIPALEHARDWPLPYNTLGCQSTLPAEYRHRCVHGRLVCWVDDGWLYPCTVAFGRFRFRDRIGQDGIAGAWKRLTLLPCRDCGTASELAFLFRLKPSTLWRARF